MGAKPSNRIPLIEMFPRDSRAMFVFCTLVLLLSLFIQSGFIESPLEKVIMPRMGDGRNTEAGQDPALHLPANR